MKVKTACILIACLCSVLVAAPILAQQQTYVPYNPYAKQPTPPQQTSRGSDNSQNNTWNQPASNSWGTQQPNQAGGQTDWNRSSGTDWSTRLPPVNIPPPIVLPKLPQISASTRCKIIATVLPSAVAGLAMPTGYVFTGLAASAMLRNHVDVHACADSAAR